MGDNWYYNLKRRMLLIRTIAIKLREEIVLLLLTNQNITTDINLAGRVGNIVNSVNISSEEIEDFIKLLLDIERKGKFFLVDDLEMEIFYIEEICTLEIGYYISIMECIQLINNSKSSGDLLLKDLEENYDNSMRCFNLIDIDHMELKKIKKERKENR